MKIPRQPWIYPDSPNIRALMTDIMNAKVPEILVSGPRNCGKSWIIAQCELTLAEMYPGIQILNIRHEMSAMGALLNQWDNDILEYGLDDRRNPFTFHSSTKSEPRTHIRCNNTSKIMFAGMDKPNKALGTALDFAFYNEVQLEAKETHWSAILGSMEGGRAGNWGDGKYLAIADMNPTHKRFWAYLRAHPDDENEVPAIKHYYVKHIDHPQFYVWDLETWTNKGSNTVGGLDRAYIVGTFDHMRNALGEFCSAEGAVYPQYNPKVHDIDLRRDDIPFHAKWRFSCDWGSINAVGLYAEYDGIHYMFKEIYRKFESVQDILARMKAFETTYHIPDITDTFVDHEIDNRFQVTESGYRYTLAAKREKAGCIEDVKYALANGLIYFNKHSLDDPDPKLAGKLQRLTHELLALAYKTEDNNTRSDNLPDTKHPDHACDHLQYYVVGCAVRPQISYPSIMKPVSNMKSGELTFGV